MATRTVTLYQETKFNLKEAFSRVFKRKVNIVQRWRSPLKITDLPIETQTAFLAAILVPKYGKM